jgi:hypothetical protein
VSEKEKGPPNVETNKWPLSFEGVAAARERRV